MRMTIRHVDIKETYDRFGRDWFATYSYYNFKDESPNIAVWGSKGLNREAKDTIVRMVQAGYLIRENGKKIEFVENYPNYIKGIELKERWRLSGTALFELNSIIDDEIFLTNEDYAEVALKELVKQ